MVEYIYRISGVNHFDFVVINGKIEKVFHAKFWWKTYVDFFAKKDIYKPRNYHKVIENLQKQFENTQIKFITIPDDTNQSIVYDITDYPINNFEFTISNRILEFPCCKKIALFDEAV